MILNLLTKYLKQYGFYFLLFVVAAAQVLFVSTVLVSMVNSIGDNKTKLATLSSEVSDLQQILDSLNNLDKGNLDADLQKATAALPDEKKTSGLITGLSNLAGLSNVVVKNLEFSPGLISTNAASLAENKIVNSNVIKGGGIKTINASMTVTSDLNSLVDFLAKLSKASQLLGVSSLQYGSQTGAGNQSSLSLYIYYQPPKETPILIKQVTPLTQAEKDILVNLGSTDIFTLQ